MDVVNPVERLVLGHMPLIGVSYQSREKDEEYRKKFAETSEIRCLIKASIKLGIRRFAAASPCPTDQSSLHLEVLKSIIQEGNDIELIPCVGIPLQIRNRSVDPFRRWATYLQFENSLYPRVIHRILNDPILNFREGWKYRLPESKPFEKTDLDRLTINWKWLENDMECFMGLPVFHMEPGSEIDFLTIAKRFDLIGELIDRIKQRGFKKILMGVHHAGITIPLLEEQKFDFKGYVTPINPIGVMMFPTKASAENAIKSTKKGVYAIKPLAGGRVDPDTALTHVFNFEIEGCMVGVASKYELEEAIKATKKIIVPQ